MVEHQRLYYWLQHINHNFSCCFVLGITDLDNNFISSNKANNIPKQKKEDDKTPFYSDDGHRGASGGSQLCQAQHSTAGADLDN